MRDEKVEYVVFYEAEHFERIKTYEYKEEYIVSDSLTYKGEETTNLKELNLANQGGVISLRYTIENLRNIFIRGCRNNT